jgi:hypothetical protein
MILYCRRIERMKILENLVFSLKKKKRIIGFLIGINESTVGLDYSIINFMKRKLEDSLNWLNQNSAGNDRVVLRLEMEIMLMFLG